MVWSLAELLAVVCSGLLARADPVCVQVYRQAYIDHAGKSSPSTALTEAYGLYAIYFDYSNGISEAYLEARQIFQALAVRPAQEQLVLATLKAKMEQGELCNGLSPMRLSEVVEVLRKAIGDN